MSDKEIIIKAVASHGTQIAKVIFPNLPEQALQTLISMGVKNKMNDNAISQVVGFLFDESDNLPSPKDFWDVFKGVLNDKPVSFNAFGKKVIINGKDIDEIQRAFENNKILNS